MRLICFLGTHIGLSPSKFGNTQMLVPVSLCNSSNVGINRSGMGSITSVPVLVSNFAVLPSRSTLHHFKDSALLLLTPMRSNINKYVLAFWFENCSTASSQFFNLLLGITRFERLFLCQSLPFFSTFVGDSSINSSATA